jgi:hypothetical protein
VEDLLIPYIILISVVGNYDKPAKAKSVKLVSENEIHIL